MIRVMIADDHAVVRKGVQQILEEARGIVVIGTASSGSDVLSAVRHTACDVLLLDIGLPDINGIEVLKQIRTLKPELHVLILSMYPEEQYALRALKAGASGYLTKESAPDELVAAVRKVALGGKYVTTSLAERLASRIGTAEQRALHETLSDREYQVMCMLAAGKKVSHIAAELILSAKTVSTYRGRIIKKLGLSSTAEIIRYAIKHGLVE